VQGKVRWAMAGRNKAKLEEIRQELAKQNPAVEVSHAAACLGRHTMCPAWQRQRAATRVL
jgi:short subunit dehydrogenase-like uncharacterized protein